MDIPCDSGYGSFEGGHDDEVLDNLDETVDEHLNEMEERTVSLERVSEAYSGATSNTTKEDVDDEEESFQDWLRKVAEYLEGRKKGDPEKMDAVVTEKLTEVWDGLFKHTCVFEPVHLLVQCLLFQNTAVYLYRGVHTSGQVHTKINLAEAWSHNLHEDPMRVPRGSHEGPMRVPYSWSISCAYSLS